MIKEIKKPCPFCGVRPNAPESPLYVECDRGAFRVVCSQCGGKGPYGITDTKAIELWNERVGDEQA